MVVLIKSKEKSKLKSKVKSKPKLYNPNSKKNKIKHIFLSFIYLVLAVYFGKTQYSDIKTRIDIIKTVLPIEEQNKVLPILNLILINIFSSDKDNRNVSISIIFRIIVLLETSILTYNVLSKSNNENLKLSIGKISIEIIFYTIFEYFAPYLNINL